MSQAPAMPVFTDALLGDTLHLSNAEFGSYCLLLFATWRNNGQAIADDDRKLARICRVTVAQWQRKLRPILVPFFCVDDGFWHQKRLEKEWVFVAQRARVSRANGSQGGRPTALNTNETDNPAGSFQDTRKQSTHTFKKESKEESKKESPPHPSGAYPPVGVEPEPAAKANGHERRKARRGIPADWQPSEQDRDYAHTEGYADEWIAAEAAHFVDHHRANDSLFADHSAAWRNWVRNATKFAPRNGSAGRSSHVQNPPSLLRAAAIALGKAHLDD
jgi:uncharacterized protein YdaU (DUF1376 family)